MIRETINWVKSAYATPTAEALALRELEDAKRKLLDAQTSREYAESMCKFREAQIKRLTAYLHKATEEPVFGQILLTHLNTVKKLSKPSPPCEKHWQSSQHSKSLWQQ